MRWLPLQCFESVGVIGLRGDNLGVGRNADSMAWPELGLDRPVIRFS